VKYGKPIFYDERVRDGVKELPLVLNIMKGLTTSLDTDIWDKVLEDELKVEDVLLDSASFISYVTEAGVMTAEQAELTLKSAFNLTQIVTDSDLDGFSFLADLENCDRKSVEK